MAHGRFIFSNYLEQALMRKTLGTRITPLVILFSQKYCPPKKKFAKIFDTIRKSKSW